MKVGDRVRLAMPDFPNHRAGDLGTITAKYWENETNTMFGVVLDPKALDEDGKEWAYLKKEIELCDAAQDSPAKITPKEYTAFVQQFYTNIDWKHLRFGQAFMVHFDMLGQDKTLFYTEDLSKAVEIIFDKYVELEDGK